MITISTRCYTTEQLKDLAEGLSYAANRIRSSPECKEHVVCTTDCKAYSICRDLDSTIQYMCKKIKERESLELHRDTQESK